MLLKRKEIEEKLIKIVKENRGNFGDFLEFVIRLKNNNHYSLQNLLLIYSQFPSATKVMGFKTFQKLGRKIKKGEKGIFVIAPLKKKVMIKKEDPLTGEEKEIVEEKLIGFKKAYVFDISQTESVQDQDEDEIVFVPNRREPSELFNTIKNSSKIRISFVSGHKSYVQNSAIAIPMSFTPAMKVFVLIAGATKIVLEREKNVDAALVPFIQWASAYLLCTKAGMDSSEFKKYENSKSLSDLQIAEALKVVFKIQSDVERLLGV